MSTSTLDHELNFQDNQQSEADKRLLVVFYTEAVRNESKSIEAGRAIFDDIDHIKIITPGSRDSFVTEVNQSYIERFPQQWARYKAKQDQHVSGTLLSEIPWMTKSQIAELEAVGCRTAEQLVGMPDSLSSKFMGHHQLKARVQTFLDAAHDAAPALKLQAELEKRDAEIAELRGMIQSMQKSQPAKVPLKA
jgi:hypothetical protein